MKNNIKIRKEIKKEFFELAIMPLGSSLKDVETTVLHYVDPSVQDQVYTNIGRVMNLMSFNVIQIQMQSEFETPHEK
jgi:hypothetical protein